MTCSLRQSKSQYQVPVYMANNCILKLFQQASGTALSSCPRFNLLHFLRYIYAYALFRLSPLLISFLLLLFLLISVGFHTTALLFMGIIFIVLSFYSFVLYSRNYSFSSVLLPKLALWLLFLCFYLPVM